MNAYVGIELFPKTKLMLSHNQGRITKNVLENRTLLVKT